VTAPVAVVAEEDSDNPHGTLAALAPLEPALVVAVVAEGTPTHDTLAALALPEPAPAAVAAAVAEDDHDTLGKALVLPEADTLASDTPDDTLEPAVGVAAVSAAGDEPGPELELEPVLSAVEVEQPPVRDTELYRKVHPHPQQRPSEQEYDTFPEENTRVPVPDPEVSEHRSKAHYTQHPT